MSAIEQSRERDDYRCRVCGSGYNVHTHHIQYRSLGGENSLNNYITLCAKCHELEHSHKIKLHFELIDNHLEVFVEKK